MSTENICGLKKENFQAEVQGKQTDLFILKNDKGYEVAITNYGGALVAIIGDGYFISFVVFQDMK